MPSTTSTQFRTDIEIALGGSMIDVELFEEDYNYAFDKAIRVFKQRGNNNLDKQFISFDVVPDTFTYDLSAHNIEDIIRIIKTQTMYSSADPFYSSFVQQFWSNFTSMGDQMADYELSKQQLQEYSKYTLHETQFIFKKSTGMITLLNNPKVEESWAVECMKNLSDAEYEEVIWIRNYTIAEAKVLLGSAYRKFQALSTPSGETSLAGDTMVTEGKEEQLILLENIGDYVDGDGCGSVFVMG